MTPKYGDIAEVSSADLPEPLVVMVIAPWTDERVAPGASWAMILKGRTPFDGALRGPGYIGPIQNAGSHIRWIDHGA